MFLRASQLLFITSLVCFIGICIARSTGDDDSETPSKTDKDLPKEKEPDENKEKAGKKAIEKELEENKEQAEEKAIEKELDENKEKAEEKALEEEMKEVIEAVSEMASVVSDANDEEKEIPFSEKPPEIKEESATEEEELAIEEEESKNEPPVEKQETSSAAPTAEVIKEKEEAPEDAFAVWSDEKKICLLAKFHAVFSIMYSSQRGEEKAEITIPKTANSKGKCGPNTKFPVLQLSWGKYVFKMVFNKTDEDTWALTSMELTYDTAEPLFDGAVNAGKKTARSKDITLFETSLKNSYFCPGQEIVLLYAGNKQAVTVRIRELQLQPFEIENGQFSPTQRCSKVVIDEETPYVQDETVPFAVGCTLALITLIILVGFSVHRAYHAAKVDYNSME